MGEEPESAASREVAKQSGLQSVFQIVGFLRKREYVGPKVIEDKQFIIVRTTVKMSEPQAWGGGESRWLAVEDLKQQDEVFSDTYVVIDMVASGQTYRSVSSEPTAF